MSDVLVLNSDAQPLSMVPMSVIPWQTAIRLVYQNKTRVVHEYDHWKVHSPSITLMVPSVVMTTEYVKWNRVVKYNRSNILLRDNFTCQYCNGTEENYRDLTLDHVVPRSRGGKTNWLNIVTSCRRCNHRKGDNHMVVPKKMPARPNYYEMMSKRMKMSIIVKHNSWLPYLNWPPELVKIQVPKEEKYGI